MVNKGLVTRLYKDLYYVVPLHQDAGNYLPDWHLLAEPLTKGASFYIGYYSALQVHGLITQPSLKEQIVWDYGKSKSIDIKGVEFQIISHNISFRHRIPKRRKDFNAVEFAGER